MTPKARAAVFVLLLSACSHDGTVRERAAFDLDCPEAELRAEESGDVIHVSGCGTSAAYRCHTASMESICRAAAPPESTSPPRRLTPAAAAEARAPADLACPADAVKVFSLAGEAYGATGCGRRISYACSQRLWSYGCRPETPPRAATP